MNRWLAGFLAIVGGGIAAYVLLLFVGGGILGLLWIFVYGDDPWPAWTNRLLGPLLFGLAAIAWAWLGWRIWKALIRRR